MNKISEEPITFNQMQGAAFAVDNVAILTDALCTASLKVNEWQALMSLIHTVLEPASSTLCFGLEEHEPEIKGKQKNSGTPGKREEKRLSFFAVLYIILI